MCMCVGREREREGGRVREKVRDGGSHPYISLYEYDQSVHSQQQENITFGIGYLI